MATPGKNTIYDDANLAQDCYNDREPTRNGQPIDVGGVKYFVLDRIYNKQSGYSGTIYQRVDSGEITLAHRGTELPTRDLATDLMMVTSRANNQLKDAHKAADVAEQFQIWSEEKLGHKVVIRTVGHSLGGTHAEVIAYERGWPGEGFNSFGAANLNVKVAPGSKGSQDFHTHIVATDFVSAASRHYGDVHIYARESDITALRRAGYGENRGGVDAAVIVQTISSHYISNFATVDGENKKQPSILTKENEVRAQQHEGMITSYRNGVYQDRAALHVILNPSHNPVKIIKGAVDDYQKYQIPDEKPAHPSLLLNQSDKKVFDKLRSQLGSDLPDAHLVQAVADLRSGGLRGDNGLEKAMVHNGAIIAMGDASTGFARSKTQVDGVEPNLQVAMQNLNQANEQHNQFDVAYQQQQQQRSQSPGMQIT